MMQEIMPRKEIKDEESEYPLVIRANNNTMKNESQVRLLNKFY